MLLIINRIVVVLASDAFGVRKPDAGRKNLIEEKIRATFGAEAAAAKRGKSKMFFRRGNRRTLESPRAR